MNQLVPIRSPSLPSLVSAAGVRFLEFFAANIRNPHTRRACARAADEFLTWCASAGVPSIGAVQPVHVATWTHYQKRFDRLFALAKAGDWDGVGNYEVKGSNSYSKMVARYRQDLLAVHAASEPAQ